jgi:hypothetical protein
MADPAEIYLHIVQEGPSRVRNGCQEGGIEATGKDSESICCDGQTCGNVIQSNLSDCGFGGHLGGGGALQEMSIFNVCISGNLQFHWLLFISRFPTRSHRCDSPWIFPKKCPPVYRNIWFIPNETLGT